MPERGGCIIGGGAGGSFFGTKATGNSKVKLPSSRSKIKHIFRDKPGHLPDTEENRSLILKTANNPKDYLGKDKYGNDWYSQTRADGTQIWVEARNGEIWDAGINSPPRDWNSQTRLKDQPFPHY